MQAQIAALEATVEAHHNRMEATDRKVDAANGRLDKFLFLLIGTLLSSMGACVGIVVMLLTQGKGK